MLPCAPLVTPVKTLPLSPVLVISSVPTKIALVGVPFGLLIVGTLGPLLAKLV